MRSERAYLLERCLRLEAQIAILQGQQIAPPLPPIQRRQLYDPRPSLPLHPKHQHRIKRLVTADEIAQMRELRRRGMHYNEIARRMSRSVWTARRHTFDVLIGRQVGES